MNTVNQKRFIKVSFQGETKRLKFTTDYEALVKKAREAFAQESLPAQFKFFYLDDENEMISINSQGDLTEALSIEDFSSLKLTVAENVGHARQHLERSITDNMSLAESLSQSQFLSQPIGSARTFKETISDFEKLNHEDFDRDAGQIQSARPNLHEMACGGDEIITEKVDMATDVNNLNKKSDFSCNTNQVHTKEQMINTHVETHTMGSQATKEFKNTGCDGIKVGVADMGSQMAEVEVSELGISCNLMIPDIDESGEEAIEPEATCFKCNGSQMNKKGLPCRKCNGTGVLASRELNAITAIVREEVREFCQHSFKGMFVDYLKNKREEQAKQVHQGIVCDGCEVAPITGIRYMCSVCSDFDICEKCEANAVHRHHALLKIRKASQAPNKLICQFKNGQGEEAEAEKVNIAQAKAASLGQSQQQQWGKPRGGKKNNIRYSGRFVKESFSDGHQVQPGEQFTKSWTFRNDGVTAWPVDLLFIQTSGDEMGASPVSLNATVNSNTEYDWIASFKAPTQPGRYTAFFRMATPTNIRFGHKVWCQIQVMEKADEQMVQEPMIISCPKLVPQNVPSEEPKIEQSPVVVAELGLSSLKEEPVVADKSGPDGNIKVEVVEELNEYNLDKLNVSADFKANLMRLYDLGFTDLNINVKLLEKYGDIETVANQLLEGVLRESAMPHVFPEHQ